MTHEFRVGDSLPSLEMQARYADGRPFDLTGYTPVLKLIDATGSPKTLAGTLVVTAAATGWVRYDWHANDLNTAGDYTARLVATRTADSKVITFPNEDDPTVVVKVRA
ncbi:MAG: BppU family phage baseplate upper protein [Gemmatimonadales bacterium]